MPVQFSGTLDPGQYQEWGTWGWSPELLVLWSVRPSPGQIGTVSLRALAIESADDGTLTYVLTVWNVGREVVAFDAVYSATSTAQTVYNDGNVYTLTAGQTISLQWDFGVPPALLTLVAVPVTFFTAVLPNVVFSCSTPSIQLNTDGTATYFFSVTNTGTGTGLFRMKAGLNWDVTE